jgi:DNA-binding beta-propeller fold protein YncE
MSPDGSRFAIVTDSYTVQVRSADTGRMLQSLSANNPIEYLAFNPNDHQIVGGDYYGQIEVWNGAAARPRMLGTSSPIINDIRFNRSGSEFVTASGSGMVDVWNARDDRIVNSIDACPSPNTAAFSPDGSKIVVACGDSTVRVFDAGTRQTLTVLQSASAGIAGDAAFSPDGNSIVAAIDAGDTGYVQVWNAELATSSLKTLEKIAEKRVTQKLTAAQQQQYLTGG